MSTTTAPELRATCSARDISAAVFNCSFNFLSSFARAAIWLASTSCGFVAVSVSASCGITPPQQLLRPRKLLQLQQLIHLRQHRFHALPHCLTLPLQALELLRCRARTCCLCVHLLPQHSQLGLRRIGLRLGVRARLAFLLDELDRLEHLLL